MYSFLDRKRPGEVDIPEVQDIKRIIREAEAVSGIETSGCRGARRAFSISPSIRRVRSARTRSVRRTSRSCGRCSRRFGLSRSSSPVISPIRTVRIACARRRSIARSRRCVVGDDGSAGQGQLGRRRRSGSIAGAWQEWPIHEATWLVPLSQEELRLKIQAIFKHQSQKDSAPFPGGYDEREFWQRVEARNKGTAAELDRLGLAEYFAMEAYVVE